ncbi:hypothetical protein [Providencia phage PSTCR6]|nr:hypothetical protein [Providencia phage PSTCR6]
MKIIKKLNSDNILLDIQVQCENQHEESVFDYCDPVDCYFCGKHVTDCDCDPFECCSCGKHVNDCDCDCECDGW